MVGRRWHEGSHDEAQTKGDGSGQGGGSRDGEHGVFTSHLIGRAFPTTLLKIMSEHPSRALAFLSLRTAYSFVANYMFCL